MSDVPAGMVKVKVNGPFRDGVTNYVYHNGDEPVVTPDEASRMVNEGHAVVLEEGEPSEEAQARAATVEQPADPGQGNVEGAGQTGS